MHRILYLFLFTVILALNTFGQAYSLEIDGGNSKELKKLNYRKKFNTKEAAKKELSNVLFTLRQKGYLLASADSTIEDQNNLKVQVSEGARYKTAKLGIGNLNPGLASKLGISEKMFVQRPFKYTEVARSMEKIIAYYENNGYPFAAVKLDSIKVNEDQFSAIWNVSPGQLFKIDSIQIIGTSMVNRKFLFKYLSIKEGMRYDESAIRSISQKCRQLPFIIEKQAPETRLTDHGSKLRLNIDKKNASQFDGIVGLLPDANTKKTVITGDVKLKVVNGVFRNGETFDLEWRRLQTQTQDFRGRMIYPYLFGTPVGTDYAIKIYRKDTTFIDIHNSIGIQYYFKGLNNFKVFYKQRSSDLISTYGLSAITILPEYADIRTSSYGVAVLLEDLNYRFNPRKGISMNISSQAGRRSIRKNPKVNPLAYEKVNTLSDQFQGELEFSAYIPLQKNNVIRLGVQTAGIYCSSDLFKNELYRIGGFKTLRGFDEESIFASSYVIPTIEYRLLFSQNSNLLLFAEGAWYENNSKGIYVTDTPVSAGAGVNFETKAGILSLLYAVGNQFGNGFDPRSGKIHIGLTALF